MMAISAGAALFFFPSMILQTVTVAAAEDSTMILQTHVESAAEDSALLTSPFDWVARLFRGELFRGNEAVEPRPLVKTAKLELFYETLCPDCIELLNTSVRELFADEEFRARVDVNMYPFGNALVLYNVSEGYHFWHEDVVFPVFKCQHSDSECLGNMIQACAIDQLKTPDAFAPFAICMASYGRNTGVELSSHACGKELGVEMNAIKKCTRGRTGTQLMTEIGNKSLNPELQRDHVPWVVVNGVHEPAADDGELLKSICNVLEDPKPSLCAKKFSGSVAAAGCGGGGGHC